MCCYIRGIRLPSLRTTYTTVACTRRRHTLTHSQHQIELIIAAGERDRIRNCKRSITADHNRMYANDSMHRMVGSRKVKREHTIIWSVLAVVSCHWILQRKLTQQHNDIMLFFVSSWHAPFGMVNWRTFLCIFILSASQQNIILSPSLYFVRSFSIEYYEFNVKRQMCYFYFYFFSS